MMRKTPFKSDHLAPAALAFSVQRRVRFEEVDSLGIVWHGRYPSYLEDLREALGRFYGIGYLDFFHHGIVTPLRSLHCEYLHPLRYQEEFVISGSLHWAEAARLNLSYRIFNREGGLVCEAWSVQMMLSYPEKELLLLPPPFYRDFLSDWQAGKLPLPEKSREECREK